MYVCATLSQPVVAGHFMDDGRRFVLGEIVDYRSDVAPPQEVGVDSCGRARIVVPRGFSTDFASVPRVLWSVAPPIGRHTMAAVVHDWLYYKKIGSRKWADLVFYEAMKRSSTGWWRRQIYYRAVRLFGWIFWMKERDHAPPELRQPSDTKDEDETND